MFYLEMESPSENENVTKIENEFCKILPNEISMEKEHTIEVLDENSSFQIKNSSIHERM
jgi:hypothetical protein